MANAIAARVLGTLICVLFPRLGPLVGLAAASLISGVGSKLFSGGGGVPTPDYARSKWQRRGGAGRTIRTDKLAYRALLDMMSREPGYSQEEIASFENPTMETINAGAQANLRRLNQGAAASGSYGGGGRMRGAGDILQQASGARANARWNTRAEAARVALDDRYRRLQALEGYTLPRLGFMEHDVDRRNQFKLSKMGIRAGRAQANTGMWGNIASSALSGAMSGGSVTKG